MNRKAIISVNNTPAGEFIELDKGFEIKYFPIYTGQPISLTLPFSIEKYTFKSFPSFFDGLLPEGIMLEVLLKKIKLDADDYFGQLLTVGSDLVGAVTVEEIEK
ncbi:MAG: HipA N-terminal domain-containing protein [Candidatus Tenebribacter burtonii]|nr:HipA N-terminal domain-containing protein [Candidatus Tenebribacter burtonii]